MLSTLRRTAREDPRSEPCGCRRRAALPRPDRAYGPRALGLSRRTVAVEVVEVRGVGGEEWPAALALLDAGDLVGTSNGAGQITAQDPAAGTKVPSGATVTIKVHSKKPAPIQEHQVSVSVIK